MRGFFLAAATLAILVSVTQAHKSIPVPAMPLTADEILTGLDAGSDETSLNNHVAGRVTDFHGRSISRARITIFDIDSDDIRTVFTNTFGHYRISGLTVGHTYVMSVSHGKYYFVSGSISFTLENEPLSIDFTAGR